MAGILSEGQRRTLNTLFANRGYGGRVSTQQKDYVSGVLAAFAGVNNNSVLVSLIYEIANEANLANKTVLEWAKVRGITILREPESLNGATAGLVDYTPTREQIEFCERNGCKYACEEHGVPFYIQHMVRGEGLDLWHSHPTGRYNSALGKFEGRWCRCSKPGSEIKGVLLEWIGRDWR